MKINLKANGLSRHAAIFEKAVRKRITADFTDDGMNAVLAIEPPVGGCKYIINKA